MLTFCTGPVDANLLTSLLSAIVRQVRRTPSVIIIVYPSVNKTLYDQCGDAYSCRNTVLVSYLVTKHIPNSLFISERHFESLTYEVEGSIPDELEAYMWDSFGNKFLNMLHCLPVKHSTKWKPSVAAIASSIFELTVEATIANLSEKTAGYSIPALWH